MKHPGYALLFLASILVNAQSSIPSMMATSFQGQSDAQGHRWGTLTMAGRLPIQGALQGAPFTAQETNKREQLLSDGTRVTQSGPSQASVARDAQGRTRVERPLMPVLNTIPGRPAEQPLMIIEINDPVDGYYYVIDPARKVAHRVKYRPVPARALLPQRPAGTQAKGVLVPGGNPSQPETRVDQLGSKFINGVQAEGRRVTMIIPVGMRGNDRPVTEVNETWQAPSLQLTILQTTRSPFGDSTFELANLSTVNPTPDMFRPPAGFEVRDQPATFTVEFGIPGTAPNSAFRINGGSAVGGTVAAPPLAGTQR